MKAQHSLFLCLVNSYPHFKERETEAWSKRLVQGHPVCNRARIITQDIRLPMEGIKTPGRAPYYQELSMNCSSRLLWSHVGPL